MSNPRNDQMLTGPVDRAQARPPAKPVAKLSEPAASAHGVGTAHYAWLLRRHIWKVLAFVIVALTATALVNVRLTPEYESTATLYVDRGAAKDIVGQDAARANNALGADVDTFLASHVKLLQSDVVVRPVAEKYHLLEHEKQVVPTDPRDRQVYARTSATVLKGLRITRAPNTSVIQITYRSTDRDLSAAVANAIAQSYLEFTYDLRITSSASLNKFMTRQLDGLASKMAASGARLSALETELNAINPEEKTNTLSARLLQMNTEYTKVQADRVRAEAARNMLAGSSIEAALASSQGDELKVILKRLNEARERFADVKARFGSNHPEYAPLQATVSELERQVDTTRQSIVKQAQNEYDRAFNQEALLQKNVAETKAEWDHLNQRSFEYQRAKREADADRLLYEELVRKIREDEINSGFQNNTVRLADSARPAFKPVFPNVPLNMAIALFLSVVVAAALVVVVDRMDTTLRDPEQVTGALGSRVVGTLPALKARDMRRMALLSSPDSKEDSEPEDKAAQREIAMFGEAIRTIRNSILLTDFDRQIHSMLLTSAEPSVGKSTIAAHLAMSHAERGQRTLLIDGDLRRPRVHELFDLPNSSGLSSVLAKGEPWRDKLVQPRPDLSLFLLTAGPVARRSAELVGPALPQLLEEACEAFDLVILDSPPLLGFSETLQMAASVDGVIVVAKTGVTHRSSLGQVLRVLAELRANTLGVVLNGTNRETGGSYYYYGQNYAKYYGKRK